MKVRTTLASAMALIAAACASQSANEEVAVKLETAPAKTEAKKLDATAQDYPGRMLAYGYQMRVGRYEVAGEAVAMMEAATQADPGNAELWAHLGNAYALQALTLNQPGQNPMNALTVLGKAFAAQEKALAIDPDNLIALGGHGSNAMVFSMIRQQPELATRGVAEMNRAVDLAPSDSAQVQRLLRVQTMINMPAPLRNRAVEMEDFDYLIRIAKGTRQGDYMHLLKADVAIEAGRPDIARAEYAMAAAASHTGGEIARRRMAALDAGGVPASAIAELRRDIGQCTTCHGT